MQLDLAGQRTIDFPNAETIAAELRAGARDEDFFAILSEFDARFIQTAGNDTDGFTLEYQDGGLNHHYRCANEQLAVDQVLHAFQLYLAKDKRWLTQFAWEKVDLT